MSFFVRCLYIPLNFPIRKSSVKIWYAKWTDHTNRHLDMKITPLHGDFFVISDFLKQLIDLKCYFFVSVCCECLVSRCESVLVFGYNIKTYNRDERRREMLEKLRAEATEWDFKAQLEIRKPKSWLKSISAFANGIGGTLLFGVDDERHIVGLDNAQANAELISRLIKDRITPLPQICPVARIRGWQKYSATQCCFRALYAVLL